MNPNKMPEGWELRGEPSPRRSEDCNGVEHAYWVQEYGRIGDPYKFMFPGETPQVAIEGAIGGAQSCYNRDNMPRMARIAELLSKPQHDYLLASEVTEALRLMFEEIQYLRYKVTGET